MQRGSLAAACVLVIGVYAYMAHSGIFESLSPTAADTYYNLLVQGFRAGQLSLKKEAPPGLAQLADPYDSTANALYRSAIHDMSYYKGRLYLYFGVTPALVLFWPSVALTGDYLFNRQGVLIFCSIGFLVSVVLLHALWRRYFAEMNAWVVAACALALGLATLVPVLLMRCEVYEVAISCGYMLTMLALGAIWCALHEPQRRCRWLAAASVAYGLAVGARPSLLFGGVILLAPVVQAWRAATEPGQRRQIWAPLMAATVPIVLVGVGLMLYNNLRFGSPFEFGFRYQLASDRQATRQNFDLHHLWFNFRAYFLQPARWSSHFPFVHEIVASSLPPGHGLVEHPFGILTNIPLVWLALAAPLAWRSRLAEARAILRGFLATLALFFGICALTVGLFYGTSIRYEVEFLPVLLFLAVVGIFGLERALADRLVWRHAVRSGWGLLLGVSVAFNLFAGVERYVETHNSLGIALGQAGRAEEGIGHFEQALQIMPDYAEAHYNLGVALVRLGRVQEAIGHFEQALRIKPDDPETNFRLGVALGQTGRLQEAVGCLERALQNKPGYAEAHYNLGVTLVRLGRVPEAMAHWEQALRINPDYAVAHYNLGVALKQAGKVREAVEHYEQALRIKPDYAEAQSNLAEARAALRAETNRAR